MSLSVVISAYNEEKKIKDCLESVNWADEIIFVDNYSQDKTVEIAHQFTTKIFKRPNNLMLNTNKNFGFTKANSEWLLSLDADERVAPELAKEIQEIISKQDDSKYINGYWIPRKNIIFGKWIQHTGWYPDYQLRLFKKGMGKFKEKHVHEMINLEGETDYLKNNIIHLNYETISQFLYKHIHIYAPNETENLLQNKYNFNYLDAIRFPVKEFLSRFFLREGYKDGFHGLMLSLLMSFYHLIIFANIWERRQFQTDENKDFLNEVQKEFKRSNKELIYWFSKEKIKKEKSQLKKTWWKIQNKFFNK